MKHLFFVLCVFLLTLCGCDDDEALDVSDSGGDTDTDTDADTDADTDSDTDTDTDSDSDAGACECSGTTCCDGCNFLPSTTQCSTSPEDVEYRCSSSDCGANVEMREQHRFCTGSDVICDDTHLQWSTWSTESNCSSDSICVANAGTAECHECVFGCLSGECDACIPSWASHVVFDSGYDDMNYASARDFSGDGNIDVLGATDVGTDLFVNSGASTPSWTSTDVSNNFGYKIFPFDCDNDGDFDFMSSYYMGTRLWKNTNGLGTSWSDNPVDISFDANRIAFGDIDGDGHQDFVASTFFQPEEIAWWSNTLGDGSFWTKHSIESLPSSYNAVWVADIDHDGDDDVLNTVSGGPGVIRWFENTAGDGTTWSSHNIDVNQYNPAHIHSADIDGDGYLDVICTGTAYGVKWWRNALGDGTAWVINNIDTAYDGANHSMTFDVDGDLDLDVVGIGSLNDSVAWWENTSGDGTTWTKRYLSSAFNYPTSMDLADMDNDGDIDVLATSADDDTITWWENGCF